jgi:type IV secretory pathway VirB2 component (pilin)
VSSGGNNSGENSPEIIDLRTHEQRRKSEMRPLWNKTLRFKKAFRQLIVVAAGLLLAAPAFAQTGTSPWENAVSVLQQAFTSTIARGLSLVAIVVAGLTFAFGEGGSKRVLAGVLFGVGMAIAAVNFLSWLFPGS